MAEEKQQAISIESDTKSKEEKDHFDYDKDWEKKYDISITILVNEYNDAIEGIQKTDEKANKYLVVLCAIIAAFFAILPNSLSDNLILTGSLEKTITFLSWILVLLFIALIITCIIVMRSLVKCFELQECIKIAPLSPILDKSISANSLQFKEGLIRDYEKSIGSYDDAKKYKQRYLKTASKYIFFSFLILCAYLFLLFFIKLLPKL